MESTSHVYIVYHIIVHSIKQAFDFALIDEKTACIVSYNKSIN